MDLRGFPDQWNYFPDHGDILWTHFGSPRERLDSQNNFYISLETLFRSPEIIFGSPETVFGLPHILLRSLERSLESLEAQFISPKTS